MNFIKENIICPKCNLAISYLDKIFACTNCNVDYPQVNNRLVLMSIDNNLFPLNDYYKDDNLKIKVNKINKLKNFIPSSSVNLSQLRILKKLNEDLFLRNKNFKVLVLGCAHQRKKLYKIFSNPNSLILSDISMNADCDIIFDIHQIPFKSKTFDAIITTAILEHVYNPELAVENIHRVLKDDGIVYSEMPFMQQVHEGAYDFTRLSLVGHHKLFNKFSSIDDGVVAGPATAFYWSLEHLLLSFFSKNILRNVTKLFSRIFFSWIKYLDYIIYHNKKSLDGASCTYILAKKSNNTRTAREIISKYN